MGKLHDKLEKAISSYARQAAESVGLGTLRVIAEVALVTEIMSDDNEEDVTDSNGAERLEGLHIEWKDDAIGFQCIPFNRFRGADVSIC